MKFLLFINSSDLETWTDEMLTMHHLDREKEKYYWRSKINDGKGNLKKLWQSRHGIMNAVTDKVTDDDMATDFAIFFQKKVDDI